MNRNHTALQKSPSIERLDDTSHVTNKGRELRYREITEQHVKERLVVALSIYEKKGWTGPAEHPGRHGYKPRRRARDQLPTAI